MQTRPHSRLLRIITAFASVLLAGVSPTVAEPPQQEKMVKIVFRNVIPGLSPASFSAKPKTIFQVGTHYQRFEESANPDTGIHALIVSNQRDTWMVNLSSKTGQHLVDNADSFDVYAPVFDASFEGFNFGSELKYMADLKVVPTSVRVANRDLRQYEHSSGRRQIRLTVTKDTEIPYAAGLFEGGRLLQMVRYLEYEANIEPDFTLFEKPPGIAFVDVDVDTPTQK